VSLAAFAAGDGVYLPEVAYPAMPKIPVQRALLTYRDGIETLVVESGLETDSPSVGWVLPLPAEPATLAVADPGMLPSLAFCVRPAVVHDLQATYWPAVLILMFLVPLALFAVLTRGGVTVWAVVFWGAAYVVLLSLTATAGGPVWERVVGVDVRSPVRVGGYDVAVLRARDAGALSDWLAANSLKPLDEPARHIAEEYISEGWCFVVGRLARDRPGAAVPHPIRATFPAARPVYPMRLTALAGSKCRVELFVVANGSASAEGFRVVVSGWCSLPPDYRMHEFLESHEPSLAGFVVGSPDVQELMWDGCTVTRLEAHLEPSEMDRDVQIGLGALSRQQTRVWSARGRRETVLSVVLWGLIPLVLSCAIVCYKRRRPSKEGLVLLGSLGGAILLVAAIVYAALPVVPVGPGRSRSEARMRLQYIGKVAQAMAQAGFLNRGPSPAALADFPRQAVLRNYWEREAGAQAILNPFTGEPMRLERSPGNFSTRQVGDQVYFCLYDDCGREIQVMPLPPPGCD
jgi:hypothetical protein